MGGYVYVLRNPAMPGLLKIGHTARDLKERVRELTTTGVPGRFSVEFYCYVESSASLERKVHKILRGYRYDKEFFSCSVEVAVLALKNILFEEKISVASKGGVACDRYLTDDEVRQLEEFRRLKEIQDVESRRLQEVREVESRKAKMIIDRRVSELTCQVKFFAPKVSRIISSRKTGSLFNCIGYLGIISVVGMPFADVFLPTPFDDGKRIGEKLSSDEKEQVLRLMSILEELKEIGGFDSMVLECKSSNVDAGGFLFSCGKFSDSFSVSDWLLGLSSGIESSGYGLGSKKNFGRKCAGVSEQKAINTDGVSLDSCKGLDVVSFQSVAEEDISDESANISFELKADTAGGLPAASLKAVSQGAGSLSKTNSYVRRVFIPVVPWGLPGLELVYYRAVESTVCELGGDGYSILSAAGGEDDVPTLVVEKDGVTWCILIHVDIWPERTSPPFFRLQKLKEVAGTQGARHAVIRLMAFNSHTEFARQKSDVNNKNVGFIKTGSTLR